jgi:hypothetical protein
MKYISFFFLFFCFSVKAQHPEWIITPLETMLDMELSKRNFTYFKDVNNHLNKFEGTWLYTNGSTSFKIIFIKLANQTGTLNSKQKEDVLITRYEYKVNNSIVFETITTNRSLVKWGFMYFDPNKICMLYNEPSFTHCSKQRIGELELTYNTNPSGQPTLSWVRTDAPVNQQPFPCTGETTSDISDFLAPANMVLIKQ